MSQPQMNHLRPDIVLIEYSDPRAKEIHISTNTYALLKVGRMLLVDTNVSSLLPTFSLVIVRADSCNFSLLSLCIWA